MVRIDLLFLIVHPMDLRPRLPGRPLRTFMILYRRTIFCHPFNLVCFTLQTNNFNELPFQPLGHDSSDNSTHDQPTGQLLQIVMKDEYGNPLDPESQNGTTPVSHVFLSRDEVPDPIISRNIAVKMGDYMIPHKVCYSLGTKYDGTFTWLMLEQEPLLGYMVAKAFFQVDDSNQICQPGAMRLFDQ